MFLTSGERQQQKVKNQKRNVFGSKKFNKEKKIKMYPLLTTCIDIISGVSKYRYVF